MPDFLYGKQTAHNPFKMNKNRSADEALIRRSYEAFPYPGPERRALKRRRTYLAPVKWITAVSGMAPPKRILVAGCGTGREAFDLRREFPKAEIVGVDFSARSVAMAQELQRGERLWRDIRFLVGNLASRSLRAKTGGDFDFTTCHGVLSYVTRPVQVLENLRRCATSEGTLFLGVNGSRHDSSGLRAFLTAMGIDVAALRDFSKAREALRLGDAIYANPAVSRWARLSAELVASDVFGQLIQNLPLDAWLRLTGQAGWHFQGSLHTQQDLGNLWQTEVCHRLAPRSRADVCQLAEALDPAGFHRLVFTHQPPVNPPWLAAGGLLEWKPAQTGLYSMRLPRRPAAGLNRVVLKSPVMNKQLDWQVPAWGVEMLRGADGQRSLGEILASASVAPGALRRQAYLLYQLMVLNFTPP